MRDYQPGKLRLILFDRHFCGMGLFGLFVAGGLIWLFRDFILTEQIFQNPLENLTALLIFLLIFNSSLYSLCLLFGYNVRPFGWSGFILSIILIIIFLFFGLPDKAKIIPALSNVALAAIAILAFINLISVDFLREMKEM